MANHLTSSSLVTYKYAISMVLYLRFRRAILEWKSGTMEQVYRFHTEIINYLASSNLAIRRCDNHYYFFIFLALLDQYKIYIVYICIPLGYLL
jgi:hypothetical protein